MVGLSAGLAAWAGVRAADAASYVDAGIKGTVMFMIAVVACHGWAWAARTWDDGHKKWAIIAGMVLTVAMVVTLIGGAGSFYGSAHAKKGTAERGTDAYNRADDALKKLDARIAALTKHRTVGEIEPDIESAKTDRRYKATHGCHPDHTRASADFCRDFRKLETEKAAAEAHERLDQQREKHLDVVGKGRPNSVGGWGALLAAVLGTSVEFGDALFSLLCTVALDMGAVVTVLTAELRKVGEEPARKPRPEGRILDRMFARRKREPEPIEPPAPVTPSYTLQPPTSEPEPEPPRVPERPRPRLVTAVKQPIGAVLDFMRDGIKIANAVRTGMAEAFIAYRAWCEANGLRPMTVAEFVAAMEETCPKFRIRIIQEGGKTYLLNVQLRAPVHNVVNT
jgi:hypothetical protein